MGDDSPWLFKLNQKLEIAGNIRITDIPSSTGNKIPKKFKLDLEAITFAGSEELLLFGSGSKSPKRDILLRINIQTQATKQYSIEQFYQSLRTAASLTEKEFNIEAAVVIEKILYLFNRGKNMIFKLNLQSLLNHAEGNQNIPACEIFHITLPELNGIAFRFSGACPAPGLKQIIFTASAENTSNWIDDGAILGSIVGILPLNALKDACPDCIQITDLNNEPLKIKVESVAVHRVASHNSLRLLLVTDNDSSASELIEAELSY